MIALSLNTRFAGVLGKSSASSFWHARQRFAVTTVTAQDEEVTWFLLKGLRQQPRCDLMTSVTHLGETKTNFLSLFEECNTSREALPVRQHHTCCSLTIPRERKQ
jgi:hypothetical protein